MQFLVTFGCSFVTTGDGQNIGVWYVDDGTGTCVDWEDGEPDSFVKGAQSALTLATIAGFAAAVLVTIEWLLCEICCAGCVEGLAFCAAWIVGGGVFSIYGTYVFCLVVLCVTPKSLTKKVSLSKLRLPFFGVKVCPSVAISRIWIPRSRVKSLDRTIVVINVNGEPMPRT
jgi:hypothetical protein